MMRIGLPRALSYYDYGTLWRFFFESLGAEVIVSEPTTRATLQIATSRSTADLCFPAKVYIGHLLALADQVDLVFVPSLRRPAPAAIHCAKIIGLPDLARSALPDREKILAVDVDLDKGPLALAQAVRAAARPLTWNPIQIARAAQTAWNEYQERKNHRCGPLAPELAGYASPARRSLTLGVVGHPYLLEDEYVNNGLLRRLEKLQVRLVTPGGLADEVTAQGVEALTGEAYWAYAPSLIGAGMHLLESGGIDGLLAAIAFGCAPDSGLAPILSEAARRKRVPMLTLTLDEHSGEAGLMTRLEAFVDMLERVRLPR
jgi:predicted nucleotide-binding protein (sugar kinase/HSP70/actin superfamily)